MKRQKQGTLRFLRLAQSLITVACRYENFENIHLIKLLPSLHGKFFVEVHISGSNSFRYVGRISIMFNPRLVCLHVVSNFCLCVLFHTHCGSSVKKLSAFLIFPVFLLSYFSMFLFTYILIIYSKMLLDH